MSVLKKSTLSLLCAGLLMSSCSSKCGIGSLFGWIATGGGATLTALSAWFYKSSNQTRLKHQQSLMQLTCSKGACWYYKCPGNDSCEDKDCCSTECKNYKKDKVKGRYPTANQNFLVYKSSKKPVYKEPCRDCKQGQESYINKISANKSSMKYGKYGMYAGGALVVGGLYLFMKSKKRVEV